MNINDELNKLNDNQRKELEKWFAEQIYKLNKVSKNNVGTVLVAPLTSKANESDVIIDIGEIENFEGFSYCKIDQLRAVSKLRIQTKKYEGKYYNNLNLKTGVYSNPEVSTVQINLIDQAIQELKFKSK